MQFPEYIDQALRRSFDVDAYIFDLYDGDTVYYHAELGYFQWAMFQTGRLLGIDTPEIKGESRAKGEQSKTALLEFIRRYALNRHQPEQITRFGYKLRLRSHVVTRNRYKDFPEAEREKYGRWLVELLGCDDNGRIVNINELMIINGHAKPYDGG